MKRENYENLLNIVHAFIIVFLCAFTFRAVFFIDAKNASGDANVGFLTSVLNAGVSEVFTFIGAIAFILFGVVGIYEFAYENGIPFLSPPYYNKRKEKSTEKAAKKMMELYYEKDIAFIQEYEKERVAHVLQALGIDEPQFRHIKYELIKARSMSAATEEELKCKMEKIVFHRDYIVNQEEVMDCDRVYHGVNYFINFYTALYDSKLCADVGGIMASFIMMRMQDDIEDVDYLVVPSGSNLLLGLEVGKRLNKPVIAIRREARIIKGESWDGNYTHNAIRKNRIIVVHDVLVTGKRIYESVEKLPANSYLVDGLFCLLKYLHEGYAPEDHLKNHGIAKAYCLLDVEESKLKAIYANGDDKESFYEL